MVRGIQIVKFVVLPPTGRHTMLKIVKFSKIVFCTCTHVRKKLNVLTILPEYVGSFLSVVLYFVVADLNTVSLFRVNYYRFCLLSIDVEINFTWPLFLGNNLILRVLERKKECRCHRRSQHHLEVMSMSTVC